MKKHNYRLTIRFADNTFKEFIYEEVAMIIPSIDKPVIEVEIEQL